MSELTNLEDARQTLRRLCITALEATRALHDGIHRPDSGPNNERRAILNRTLHEMMQTREGFKLALRVADVKVASELRDLVGDLVDWSWLEEIGLRWTTDQPLEKLSGQALRYQHALIALGMLPRLPPHAITFPHGAYADIPVPTTPGETLSRLEEVEQTVWTASSEPVNALSRGAVRRTYGFFEATTYLMANHMGGMIGM